MRTIKRHSKARQKGITALEFAVTAPVILLLLFGTLEIGVMTLTQTSIASAATDVARDLRTGQIQAKSDPESAFESRLCDALGVTVGCGDVDYHVETYANYEDIPEKITPGNDGTLPESGYTESRGQDIVVVRIGHSFDFVTPIMGRLMGQEGGKRLLVASSVVTNEPFDEALEQ